MHDKMPSIETIDDFVKWIQDCYEHNRDGFRDKFTAAVNKVAEIPKDTKKEVIYQWKKATIAQLCEFFRDWYKWNPDLKTGLEYIQKFSWLYYMNEEGLAFVTTPPGTTMTYLFADLNGRKMSSPESKALVKKWMDELGSKMDDYVIPPDGYQSFNDFFIRDLKPGMRPISKEDDDAVVVSPADAIVNMIDDDLSIDRPLNVKTRKLNVRQLLDSSEYAEQFKGGTAVSCILMPDVYHHYHTPVTGRVVESREDVAGNYFGIDNFPKLINGGNVGYGYDYSVFEHFRRGYLIFETDKYGYVAMVPVGLNTIGSVVFEPRFKDVTSEKPVVVRKGEKVGYFKYGGSLNILLFEKDCFPAVRIPQGQMIGTLNEKKDAGKAKTQFPF